MHLDEELLVILEFNKDSHEGCINETSVCVLRGHTSWLAC